MSSHPVAETEGLTILDYLYPLLKWRWCIFLCAIVGSVLGFAYAARQPLRYQAETTFLPRGVLNEKDETTRAVGAMGVSWSNRRPPEMVSYFGISMRTVSLMERMLQREFMSEASGTSETLLDILDVKGETEAERLFSGAMRLKGMVKVESRSGIVLALIVQASEKHLAADLADALAQEYLRLPQSDNEFQMAVDLAQAQLTSVTKGLKLIEQEIILKRNRFIDKGPESEMEVASLERDRRALEVQKDFWYKEHGQALLRKNQFKAQSVESIRLLEPAMPPLMPLNIPASKMATTFLLLFGFLASAFTLALEYFRDLRTDFESHSFWAHLKSAKRDFILMAGFLAVILVIAILIRAIF